MARANSSSVARYEQRILDYEAARETRRPRPAPPIRARRRAAPRRSTRYRLRRIVALTLAILVVVSLTSFAAAMSAPSNTSLGVRAVEWLRDNGAAALVSDVESVYYSLNAPSTGGPALKRLPRVGCAHAAQVASYAPAPIAPVISPALAGRGRVAREPGRWSRGAAPVLVTTFRPDPNYPQMVAGVAWIDHTRTSAGAVPGPVRATERRQPARGGAAPACARGCWRRSTAASSSRTPAAGSSPRGIVYAPLKDGQATLIGYGDGTVDVRTWTGGPDPGPGVAFARQNLPLIVAGGQLNPHLSQRLAVGRDARQRGPRVALGCRHRCPRQPDLRGRRHPDRSESRARSSSTPARSARWSSTSTTSGRRSTSTATFGAGEPAKLLPGMNRPATRYLTPDDRDFFAVYARRGR